MLDQWDKEQASDTTQNALRESFRNSEVTTTEREDINKNSRQLGRGNSDPFDLTDDRFDLLSTDELHAERDRVFRMEDNIYRATNVGNLNSGNTNVQYLWDDPDHFDEEPTPRELGEPNEDQPKQSSIIHLWDDPEHFDDEPSLVKLLQCHTMRTQIVLLH